MGWEVSKNGGGGGGVGRRVLCLRLGFSQGGVSFTISGSFAWEQGAHTTAKRLPRHIPTTLNFSCLASVAHSLVSYVESPPWP